MPNEILSNSKVSVVEDESADGKIVLKIKTRKSDIGLTILVGRDDIVVVPAHDATTEITSRNGSHAISIHK